MKKLLRIKRKNCNKIVQNKRNSNSQNAIVWGQVLLFEKVLILINTEKN